MGHFSVLENVGEFRGFSESWGMVPPPFLFFAVFKRGMSFSQVPDDDQCLSVVRVQHLVQCRPCPFARQLPILVTPVCP